MGPVRKCVCGRRVGMIVAGKRRTVESWAEVVATVESRGGWRCMPEPRDFAFDEVVVSIGVGLFRPTLLLQTA